MAKLTGLATSAVTAGEVTTLDHKVLDDSVEGGAFIAEALLSSGESTEVLGGLGDSLAVEAHDNAAQVLLAMLNVEVDLVGDLGALRCLSAAGEQQHTEAQEERGRNKNTLQIEHDCFVELDDLQMQQLMFEGGSK